MFANNRKALAIGAGVVVVAGLAAVGWARRESAVAPAQNAFGQAALGETAPSNYPVNSGVPQQPLNSYGAPQAGYAQSSSGYQSDMVREDGYYSRVRRPIYVRNAMDYQQQPQAMEPPVQETYDERRTTYVEQPRTTVERRTYVSRPYREEVRHGRSTKKSVAIVAGSAGVGAAIGALAGGGKGAAIGALGGGGAGFIYDRMTHKH
ncbi:MAG: hypothetical protein JWO80_4015 [Bryobacterales bacterium]|nr:hypothetical protein [Bryobacterales bacterium]